MPCVDQGSKPPKQATSTARRWSLWRAVSAYLALSSVVIVLGVRGAGLERPARYVKVVLTDRNLLMAFTIGAAAEPRPYGFVTPTTSTAWAKIALGDLTWYGPEDRSPNPQRVATFFDDMTRFEQESAGHPVLPVVDMPPFQGEAANRRFLVDAATQHGACLVRLLDRLFLVRPSGAADSSQPFATMDPPQRPYKRWWADPLFALTLPIRLIVAAVFFLLVALFGMH